MMIRKIIKLKKFGIFDDYTSKPNLPEFKKFNLIYGWNASGKTTLSRLFRCFEQARASEYFLNAEFEVQLEDKKVVSSEKLGEISNIRVFNRDFIDENIFRGESEVAPIYYIGKEQIQSKEQLDSLRLISKELEETLKFKEGELKKKKKDLGKLAKERAGKIKEVLRTSGRDDYTYYDKSSFLNNIKSVGEVEGNTLSDEDVFEKKKKINESIKSTIDLVQIQQNLLTENDISTLGDILRQLIVSEVIEKLKSNEDLNNWVGDGLKLYKKYGGENCYFCGHLVSQNRIEDLRRHFNESYKILMTAIGKAKGDWESKKITLSIPDENSLYGDLMAEFKTKKVTINDQSNKYNEIIDGVLQKLKKKEKNPFEEYEEVNYTIPNLQENLKEINKVIDKHNDRCVNFSEKMEEAKKCLERHFLSESYSDYQSLNGEISKMEGAIGKLKPQVDMNTRKIETLSHKMRDYKIALDELNAQLERFLGRKEIVFEATLGEEEGYRLRRLPSKDLATSLSEGEKTAVALIYFLSKLKEESFLLDSGIAVIDDPVSSLDSNHIFQAFGLIKSKMSSARQLFILTHNFDFFRHVKHWLKEGGKDGLKGGVSFFMINNFYCTEGKRVAKLDVLDHLLDKYDSEYQYLFSLLYQIKESDLTCFKEIYPFPNIARKFMETFLSFKFPSETHQASMFSKAKKRSGVGDEKIEKIKRFLNSHSHSNIDQMTGWYTSSWSEGKAIIGDILDLVSKLDEDHFNELVKMSKSEGGSHVTTLSVRT